MDSVMCGHQAPCHVPTPPHWVLVRKSYTTPEVWTRRRKDPEVEVLWIRGVPHIRGREILTKGWSLYPPQTEDGGLDLGSVIHGERKGNRCTGMYGWYIPPIQYWTHRPDLTLGRMQYWVINIAYIRFQEGRPRHLLSQQVTWRGRKPDQKSPHAHKNAQ